MTETGSVDVTIYPEASSSDYPDGSTANTTAYVRTWYAGTIQPYTFVTDLPIVPGTQNGPGTQWTTMTVFDPYGNDRWDVDADGNIDLSQYSAATGLLMESVANVDTADLPATLTGAADTVAVPLDSSSDPLFATPSGDTTNLNAATDYTDDTLGREILSLGPAFPDADGDTVRTAQYTSYADTLQSLPSGQGEGGYGTIVAAASGFYVQTAATGSAYTAGDYVLMNPISVEVSNLDGQDTDDLSRKRPLCPPSPRERARMRAA